MSMNKQKTALSDYFCRKNCVEFEVEGDYAIFSNPLLSSGGEKRTYDIPTYEAMKGVTKSIYWKPTFTWFLDEVRVMNEIQTETQGKRLPCFFENGKPDLAYYTYLTNVKYQVRAHLEWNENRPEYSDDRDMNKHYSSFAKHLIRGGRLPVFLGKSECCADVAPIRFGEGAGFYDNTGTAAFGLMYHGITYPDEAYSEETAGCLTLDYAPVVMENGIVRYARPEDCFHKKIRNGKIMNFKNREEI